MAESVVHIQVPVELFGVPRLRAGRRQVLVDVPLNPNEGQVVQQLAAACPSLRGTVLRDDLLGLNDGYVFNVNGVAFVNRGAFCLQPGDSLLLLSSQAGG